MAESFPVGRSGDAFEFPAAVGTATADAVESRKATAGGVRRVAPDVGADLDGLRHQLPRRGVDDFFDELTDAIEHRARVVGVDGREAPRVAGVPGFEQFECTAVSHLTDQDAVRAKPHRRHDGVAPRMHPRLHENLQLIGRLALDLRRVLDDVDAIGSCLGR